MILMCECCEKVEATTHLAIGDNDICLCDYCATCAIDDILDAENYVNDLVSEAAYLDGRFQ